MWGRKERLFEIEKVMVINLRDIVEREDCNVSLGVGNYFCDDKLIE